MRKIVLLTSLSMLAVLMLAPAAGAQGNDIVCPEGAASNAAGNACTDLETGQQVEPISSNIVFPLQEGASPCPESAPGAVFTFEGGVCLLNGEPLSQTQFPPQYTPQYTTPDVPMTDQNPGDEGNLEELCAAQGQVVAGRGCVDAPTATTTTTALPATGGPSLVLLAGALLIGSGLILRGRRS